MGYWEKKTVANKLKEKNSELEKMKKDLTKEELNVFEKDLGKK